MNLKFVQTLIPFRFFMLLCLGAFCSVAAFRVEAADVDSCRVERIKLEFATIRVQRVQCEKDDSKPFCEAAEDYEPILKADEAEKMWACLTHADLKTAFEAHDQSLAVTALASWKRYSTRPYKSAHINRFVEDIDSESVYVHNYANDVAKNYGKFEKAGVLPAGAVLIKYSMIISAKTGSVQLAPAYLMTKLSKNAKPEQMDWEYDVVWPAIGNINKQEFDGSTCTACHIEFGKQHDSMLFLPKEVRTK